LFTSKGKINIRNSQYRLSENPIDDTIDSYASKNFSLGYMRHLFMSNEILGLQLATQHNIAFYLWLVRTAREKILAGEFSDWKKKFIEEMKENI
jgi:queuine tRNA-ribosyltransferase